LAIAILILTVIGVFLTAILVALTGVMVGMDLIIKWMRSAETERSAGEKSRAAAHREYEDLLRRRDELGDARVAWKAQDADTSQNGVTGDESDLA
jgi:hypothetical protein